ncbi:hypothetical protein CDV36_001182 [Fusarium kuroshium]|uniref:Uncharacterized protein n=1 Tax=Fusarium kuroshium TaxID=2010991 RepID=A0A3M2SNP0_9HYPO|nr:hypothetical protein CDV36_001182 [Fusarium kuroshium]
MPPFPVYKTPIPIWSNDYRTQLYDTGKGVLEEYKFPQDLESPVTRACVIRAIRLNLEFAKSEAVAKACVEWPEFIRARNARLIMSNQLPEPDEMPEWNTETHPYCVWYPSFAHEDTYRQLSKVFPWLRYQVGRACAAAGYAELYAELHLLPDVSIVEEARESYCDGGTAIYESIMAAPARYAVMDDLNLSIELHHPRTPAFLNGDTDVRWKLDDRWSLDRVMHAAMPPSFLGGPVPLALCIEEDMRVAETHWEHVVNGITPRNTDLTYKETTLLWKSLPQDLPTVRKKTLTHMAAYEGNLDRYARLKQPGPMANDELICVMRGIYHHGMFARWWHEEIVTDSPRVKALNWGVVAKIREAISARRIMTNDHQEFQDGWKGGPMPFMIWWPLRPDEMTLELLKDKVPEMREQVAVACIMCDYWGCFNSMKPKPTAAMWLAAEQSVEPFYRKYIEEKIVELGLDPKDIKDRIDPYEESGLIINKEPTSMILQGGLQEGISIQYPGQSYDPTGPYQCARTDVGRIDRHVWVLPEMLRKIQLFTDCGYVNATFEIPDMELPQDELEALEL